MCVNVIVISYTFSHLQGADGVSQVLNIIREELSTTMALMGELIDK